MQKSPNLYVQKVIPRSWLSSSSYHRNMPKTAKAKIWPLGTLGVKTLLSYFITRKKKVKKKHFWQFWMLWSRKLYRMTAKFWWITCILFAIISIGGSSLWILHLNYCGFPSDLCLPQNLGFQCCHEHLSLRKAYMLKLLERWYVFL
jgi:hypothetical protein